MLVPCFLHMAVVRNSPSGFVYIWWMGLLRFHIISVCNPDGCETMFGMIVVDGVVVVVPRVNVCNGLINTKPTIPLQSIHYNTDITNCWAQHKGTTYIHAMHSIYVFGRIFFRSCVCECVCVVPRLTPAERRLFARHSACSARWHFEIDDHPAVFGLCVLSTGVFCECPFLWLNMLSLSLFAPGRKVWWSNHFVSYM